MVWLYLSLAILAANLPWLSDRTLLVIPRSEPKPEFLRLVEWLILYGGFVLLGRGFERKINGEIHSQDWEYYAVTFLLFLVFAIPGFIYCHDLRQHLFPAKKRTGI